LALGETCRAYAARLSRSCVDGLPGMADPAYCRAEFGRVAIARGASDSQRESVCELGLQRG
jgi:hypothetical protein